MRSSSATQQAFDFYLGSSQSIGREETSDVYTQKEPELRGGTLPELPNFSLPSGMFAQASRRAGRLNASAISDQEVESLLLERQLLLDKKFNGTLTHAESIRLQYVRWSLDRIEDARDGIALDALESWVVQYEQFQADLQLLQEQLASRKKERRR